MNASTVLVYVAVAAIFIFLLAMGIREIIKHGKGQGDCCGGGKAEPSEAEQTVTLTEPVVARREIYIEGMHCQNCVNSVTRSLQKIDGVAAKVDLQKNMAFVEMSKDIPDEQLQFAIERLDFTVTKIEKI